MDIVDTNRCSKSTSSYCIPTQGRRIQIKDAVHIVQIPSSTYHYHVCQSEKDDSNRLLKQEMYDGEPLMTYEDFKKKIESYIDYYNDNRIKTKLAGLRPNSISNLNQLIKK